MASNAPPIPTMPSNEEETDASPSPPPPLTTSRPNYFFGVEEDIYFELFDNPALENQDNAFLSREKSIVMRVLRVVEEQILECVSADSCVTTKYYALMTLANVGLALCSVAEGGNEAGGNMSSDGSIIEGLDGEVGETPPSMMDVLLEIGLPDLLIRKMYLTEEEDSPPGSPRHRAFTHKVARFTAAFWTTRTRGISELLQCTFSTSRTNYDFSSAYMIIRSLIHQEIHARLVRTQTLTQEAHLDVESQNVTLIINVIVIYLNVQLPMQVNRRANWNTRRDALELMIALGRIILLTRYTEPSCAVAWNHELGTIVTDRMHAILVDIGKVEEMRGKLRRDRDLMDQVVELYGFGKTAFPGMPGVVRMLRMVAAD